MKKLFPYFAASSLFVLGITLYACKDSAETPKAACDTFEAINNKILTPSCATAGCHASEKDASFAQHGLVLEKSVAYKNLVNRNPKNADALADKIKLVTPFSDDESLLFHKLHSAASGAAGGHQHKNYGNPMPLGGDLLSAGQVEFIRRWIEAGALESGCNVSDLTLLDDKTPQVTVPFSPLAPPAAGQGVQLKLEPFAIAPNFEREFFVYKKLNNTEKQYINRIAIKMRQNSHHLVLYGFAPNTPATVMPQYDVVRDLRNPDNSTNLSTAITMQYHVYAGGGSSPESDFTFPEGTALEVPANYALDVNSHYVNKTSKPITGEVYVNLYTVPATQVKNIAKPLNLSNFNLNIPPKKTVTQSQTFKFDKKTNVVTLTSHMHAKGKKFVIKISGGARNGEIIYSTDSWEHPEIKNFTPVLTLQAGEGLTSEVTYTNDTDKTINFGLTSTDEMGIIFGYYYEM
jgi:hypothetical protein